MVKMGWFCVSCETMLQYPERSRFVKRHGQQPHAFHYRAKDVPWSLLKLLQRVELEGTCFPFHAHTIWYVLLFCSVLVTRETSVPITVMKFMPDCACIKPILRVTCTLNLKFPFILSVLVCLCLCVPFLRLISSFYGHDFWHIIIFGWIWPHIKLVLRYYLICDKNTPSWVSLFFLRKRIKAWRETKCIQ